MNIGQKNHAAIVFSPTFVFLLLWLQMLLGENSDMTLLNGGEVAGGPGKGWVMGVMMALTSHWSFPLRSSTQELSFSDCFTFDSITFCPQHQDSCSVGYSL